MIVDQIKTTIAGIVLAIAVIITGFVTCSITSNHYKGVINGIERENAEQVAGYERAIGAIKSKAQEETAAAISRMKDAQNKLAELDKKTSEELANAKSENDNLRRDVADGSRRVRILQANLAGCNASPNTTREIPAPAAWAMQPPSNSLKLLGTLFSVSEKESLATKQN